MTLLLGSSLTEARRLVAPQQREDCRWIELQVGICLCVAGRKASCVTWQGADLPAADCARQPLSAVAQQLPAVMSDFSCCTCTVKQQGYIRMRFA